MSDRTDRLASILKEQAANFIQREANPSPLITVTRAHISPDQKNVTLFITTFPQSGEQDALIFLKRNAGEFRQYIKTKSHLKHIPHIDFVLDVGERHRQDIDDLSREINNRTSGLSNPNDT